MTKISIQHLENAVKKAEEMNLKKKEAVFDEIYIEQPNILGSILVLKQMGNTLEQMDILINVLLVAFLALKEAGLKLETVTEYEQGRELSRFVEQVQFTEGLSSIAESDAMQQYIDAHEEKVLLAFAYTEMLNAGFTELKHENSKYLILAGINVVNCISAAKLA